MIAKFKQISQAIAYACDAIASSPGYGPIHLSAVVGGGYFLGTREVAREKLLDALQFECRQFPEATVVVGDTERGDAYAAIQCSCQTSFRKHCAHHCEHSSSRPLMLLLTAPESGVSRHRILDTITRAIHVDLKAERHRSDSCENENLSHDGPEERHEKRTHDFEQWMRR